MDIFTVLFWITASLTGSTFYLVSMIFGHFNIQFVIAIIDTFFLYAAIYLVRKFGMKKEGGIL